MKQLRNQVSKIARFPWPVLILGESGVGKELVARAIHDLSPRKENRFVPVNCAGMPDTLVESEFFGYEKGAFTGAEIQKKGKFQEADKGTIFLDEIGEASIRFELTLLRVLETCSITKIGSVKEEQVNVRVICATNKPIEKLIHDMRSDLFHRISSFPLYIPPLRERREDIPELVDFFIKQFRDEFNRQSGDGEKLKISEIDEDALAFISRLNLYGNVRELRNILQRAIMLFASGETSITGKHVREAVGRIPQPRQDDAGEALRWIFGWAVSNQSKFWNHNRQVNKAPSGGWAGRWDIKRVQQRNIGRISVKDDQWREICFTTKAVTKLLAEGDFEKKEAIRMWREQGWLSQGKKNRAVTTCRIDGKPVSVYCFKRSVIEDNCISVQINC
ncbi:MAG: AAA family ATPase [Desulfobacteraceae bacterium]|nr:AAA family ATPase [Desulfobacteraceae bacterium]